VAARASAPSKDLVGVTDHAGRSFRGGHIDMAVSGRAQKELLPKVGGWLVEQIWVSQRFVRKGPGWKLIRLLPSGEEKSFTILETDRRPEFHAVPRIGR